MARVLLYNFTDETRRRTVKAVLFRMLIPGREVSAAEQALPLGTVLGEAGFPAADAGPESGKDAGSPAINADSGSMAEAPFTDEMLVMHGLTKNQLNGLLDTLKREGIFLPLKAVVTPHNIGWSGTRLHREIQAEHAAMTGRRP